MFCACLQLSNPLKRFQRQAVIVSREIEDDDHCPFSEALVRSAKSTNLPPLLPLPPSPRTLGLEAYNFFSVASISLIFTSLAASCSLEARNKSRYTVMHSALK